MLSTQRTFDAQGIKAFIEEHGLDPVPLDDPKQYVLRGVRLSVEVYVWGRIFYAEDRAHGTGLTWTEREGDRPELPGWVGDVRARVDRPSCLGMHEDDVTCDGGFNPVTGQEERACRWRRVCIRVQELGKTPEGIAKCLGQYDDDELWSKVEARPVRATSKRDEPEVTVESVQQLVTDFCKLTAGKVRAYFAESRHRSSVGDWYLVEYPSKSGRKWTLFRRRLIGTDPIKDPTTEQSLAVFEARVRDMTARVDLRTDDFALASAMLGQWSPRLGQDHERRVIRIVLSGENMNAVSDFLAQIVQADKLTSYGRGVKRAVPHRTYTRKSGST